MSLRSRRLIRIHSTARTQAGGSSAAVVPGYEVTTRPWYEPRKEISTERYWLMALRKNDENTVWSPMTIAVKASIALIVNSSEPNPLEIH